MQLVASRRDTIAYRARDREWRRRIRNQMAELYDPVLGERCGTCEALFELPDVERPVGRHELAAGVRGEPQSCALRHAPEQFRHNTAYVLAPLAQRSQALR